MTKVGFIGLGIMGGPMAANLVKAGFDVTGHNRSRTPVEKLVMEGGKAAAGISDATKGQDIVITMLPDSPDVETVVLGADGVFENAMPDLLYIDMSTVRPSTARSLAEGGDRFDVRVLDAPVSGGESAAIEGSLSIMIGGRTPDFERARSVFKVLGETIVHVGDHGAGQTVKAANQLIVAGTIELVAEAIVFLESSDVDIHAAVRVLAGGLAGNQILTRKAAGMIARDFQPGFRVDLHHKDLGILLDSAREVGVTTPLGAVVAQLMAALRAQGGGNLDHTALIQLVERLSREDNY